VPGGNARDRGPDFCVGGVAVMLACPSGLRRSVIPGGKGKPRVESACGRRIVLGGAKPLDSAAASETDSGKSSVDMFGIRGGGVFTAPAVSVGSAELSALPAE
jgi:hypothetical protein